MGIMVMIVGVPGGEHHFLLVIGVFGGDCGGYGDDLDKAPRLSIRIVI